MNCAGKKLLFFALGIGVLVFIINAMFFSNVVIYYASGIWIGDWVVRGRGETGIFIGLFVGLFACVITSAIYSYLGCRLINVLRKQ